MVAAAIVYVGLTAADGNAASRHYGHPGTWFNRHAADQDKLRVLQSRAKHAADVTRFFENHPRLARTKQGRAAVWQHKRLAAWADRRIRQVKHRLWLRLPDTGDWQTAVRIVQRAYPGTSSWLLSCSASEGSWSAWVWNHEGSGVGGWLQFQPSTFDRMWRAALHDIRKRGFKVPSGATHWRHPLCQALAGAWGVSNGRRHEWHGSGC